MWASRARGALRHTQVFRLGIYRLGVVVLFGLWLVSLAANGSRDDRQLTSEPLDISLPSLISQDASPPIWTGSTESESEPDALPTPLAASEPTELIEPPPRQFSATFTGDMLLHTRVNKLAKQFGASGQWQRNIPVEITGDVDADGIGLSPSSGYGPLEYDYRPMLAPIQPWIEAADWAVCHMEVPLSADNTRLESYPTFRSPGDIADSARDVGYDSCTTASNHTLDQGAKGAVETLDVLERAGLHFSGSARNPQEKLDQIWLDLGGIRVAHLSYTYGFNGFRLPSDSPWMSNLIDADRIVADAGAARQGGAEYVIVSLHWGNEYIHAPSSYQTSIGSKVLASPEVDLIIGHHAHVVQPIATEGDEWLVYGLGNLLSNMSQLPRRDELLVTVTVTETADGSFKTDLEVLPVFLDAATMVVFPSDPELRPSDINPGLSDELDRSWQRVNDVLKTGSGWDQFSFAGPLGDE